MPQNEPSVIERYAAHFAQFEKGLNGESRSPLHAIRRDALARFSTLGFPKPSDEEWRFTNVAPIAGTSFSPVFQYAPAGVTKADIDRFTFRGANAALLAFIDGHFSAEFSSVPSFPKGVRIGSLASALASDPAVVGNFLAREARYHDDPFTALSTAFLRDGAFIWLDDDVVVDRPIHLLFLSSGRPSPFVSSPRNLIVAGRNSRVAIVETYAGIGQNVYWTNAVTEVVVGAEAWVEHDKLQVESTRAFHVASAHIRQGAGSTVTSNDIAFGGALVRNNITAVFDGEHAECTLNGLALATGTQHVDNHTVIDHARPSCASHELYKSILDGASRGVFNGKIFVRKDAQKTDAKQTNKTLLLSDEATIDTKPQLEIFADDVKCTHGATVGQLDEEQVFYMRSRGIGEVAARDLLTFAFASDVIQRVHVEPLREQLDSMLHARLRLGRVAHED